MERLLPFCMQSGQKSPTGRADSNVGVNKILSMSIPGAVYFSSHKNNKLLKYSEFRKFDLHYKSKFAEVIAVQMDKS